MAGNWSWTCRDVPDTRGAQARQLDALGWGAFFIWVGIAVLADVGMGIGLLGVGIITLGMQALRRLRALPWEGFWVVVGALFLLGGIWEQYAIQLELFPLLLIAAGVLLLVAAFNKGHGKQVSSHRA